MYPDLHIPIGICTNHLFAHSHQSICMNQLDECLNDFDFDMIPLSIHNGFQSVVISVDVINVIMILLVEENSADEFIVLFESIFEWLELLGCSDVKDMFTSIVICELVSEFVGTVRYWQPVLGDDSGNVSRRMISHLLFYFETFN